MRKEISPSQGLLQHCPPNGLFLPSTWKFGAWAGSSWDGRTGPGGLEGGLRLGWEGKGSLGVLWTGGDCSGASQNREVLDSLQVFSLPLRWELLSDQMHTEECFYLQRV